MVQNLIRIVYLKHDFNLNPNLEVHITDVSSTLSTVTNANTWDISTQGIYRSQDKVKCIWAECEHNIIDHNWKA